MEGILFSEQRKQEKSKRKVRRQNQKELSKCDQPTNT